MLPANPFWCYSPSDSVYPIHCTSCYNDSIASHGAVRGAVLRLACPTSHALTLAAKRREHSVSCADSTVGATLANMSVLASPPKHGCA